MEKLYYFSAQKHAHDIMLYDNHLRVVMGDMDNGTLPMDEARYSRMERMREGDLADLIGQMQWTSDGITCKLTGKQIALAKRIVAWAREYRATKCIEAGRTDLLQYC